jgi:hypothetical protein
MLIVEIGLTFFSQCKAPLKYWSYTFETFIHLINYIPSPFLNHKTPFEVNT